MFRAWSCSALGSVPGGGVVRIAKLRDRDPLFESQGEDIDIGHQRADPALILAVERDAEEDCGFRLHKVAVGGVEQMVSDPVVGFFPGHSRPADKRADTWTGSGTLGLIAFLHRSREARAPPHWYASAAGRPDGS